MLSFKNIPIEKIFQILVAHEKTEIFIEIKTGPKMVQLRHVPVDSKWIV